MLFCNKPSLPKVIPTCLEVALPVWKKSYQSEASPNCLEPAKPVFYQPNCSGASPTIQKPAQPIRSLPNLSGASPTSLEPAQLVLNDLCRILKKKSKFWNLFAAVKNIRSQKYMILAKNLGEGLAFHKTKIGGRGEGVTFLQNLSLNLWKSGECPNIL